MKKLFLALIYFSFINLSFSQKYRDGIEYKLNLSTINSAKSVTWFGWDYSHIIINDGNVNPKETKTKSIPIWDNNMEKQNFGSKKFQKLFKHKDFVQDIKSIESLVLNVPDEELVNIYKTPLDIDSIKQIIKNYKLTNTSDIGIVSIVSEMRKSDISVIVFTVIFDMKTREILYAIKARGKAGDKGSYQRFYTKGLVLAMKVFFKKFDV